jgi:hypothetical protein
MIDDATGIQIVQVAPLGGLRGPAILGNTVSWVVNGARRTYALKTRQPNR